MSTDLGTEAVNYYWGRKLYAKAKIHREFEFFVKDVKDNASLRWDKFAGYLQSPTSEMWEAFVFGREFQRRRTTVHAP